MKLLKKIVFSLLLSSVMIGGVTISTSALAYNQNVEKKLERINKNIAKQEEKITKITERQSKSNRNGTSGSTSTKISKIRDKIDDLRNESADIKKKEGLKMNRAIKTVEAKKIQSKNKILQLENAKSKKTEIAKKRYLADVESAKSINPDYKPEKFLFNSKTIDAQIKSERLKIKEYETEISVIRGTDKNKKYK